MKALAQELRLVMTGSVLVDHPLGPLTNYGCGGPGELCLMPRDCTDLAAAVEILARAGVGWCVLGGGTNVLVSDRGVPGVVILTAAMKQLSVRGEQLIAGSGLDSHAVAVSALEHGLSGAEFLAWLPGSIGGACFMNAKAYGGEIAQVMARAQVVTPEGELTAVELAPSDFSYKRSPFQADGSIIGEATFQLRSGDREAIGRRMDEIETSRRSNHEMDHPSCGCVFKNDRQIGTPSGTLIEQCGLKGYAQGDARVSVHHANFVYNTGQASATQIRNVMEHVHRTVKEQTGHTLGFEVQFIGEW